VRRAQGTARTGALLCWLLLLPGCATTTAETNYRLGRADRVAPAALPPLCEAATVTDEIWVVFSSRHCDACQGLLRDLAAEREALARRGVTVAMMLLDGTSCPDAMLEAGRSGGWPVGLADDRTREGWGVEQTPTTFLLQRGKVVGALVGRAPVAELLAFREERG